MLGGVQCLCNCMVQPRDIPYGDVDNVHDGPPDLTERDPVNMHDVDDVLDNSPTSKEGSVDDMHASQLYLFSYTTKGNVYVMNNGSVSA